MRRETFDVDNAIALCDEINEEYAFSFEYHRTMSSYRLLKAVIPEEERGKSAFIDTSQGVSEIALYTSNRFGVQVAHLGDVIEFTENGPIVYEAGDLT